MYSPKPSASKNEIEIYNRTLVEVIDFIVTTHHSYVRNTLQRIINYTTKGDLKKRADNADELNHLIEILSRDMHSHMEKEEKILFPLIKYLVETEKFGEKPKTRNYGTIKNPIRQMLSDHETSLELIKKIKGLLKATESEYTNNDLQLSFSILISEFEKDLEKHIHLENNILFPRSIELENKLLNN